MEDYKESFEKLKKKMIEAPILISPDLEVQFELMYDASDVSVGHVLGKIKDKEDFSNEKLFSVKECIVHWYADIINLLASCFYPPESTIQQRNKLLHDSHAFIWEEPYLFRQVSRDFDESLDDDVPTNEERHISYSDDQSVDKEQSYDGDSGNDFGSDDGADDDVMALVIFD
ncbi:hypothetical protein BC332_15483 [Capsicum chinense]|nr:hypothetical protein BC332_15483 [Capsicum chinense]